MKTQKKLLLVSCCILLSLCLVFPSLALRVVTPKELKELAYEHAHKCGGATDCEHSGLMLAPQQASAPNITEANQSVKCTHQHPARISAARCDHASMLYFYQLDEERTDALCPTCGMKLYAVTMPENTLAIQTSAEIRRACPHVYGDWLHFTKDVHRRNCILCNYSEVSPHNIAHVDCITNAHCEVCGGREPRWEKAWGHKMGYVANNSTFPSGHSYRCVRMDNDLQYICGYVEFSEPCDMTIYYSAAADGIHEEYEVCSKCENMMFTGATVTCTAQFGICEACAIGEW